MMVLMSQYLFAQKTLIDSNAYKSWPTLENKPTISNDGKFIVYDINNGNSNEKKINRIIQSLESDWKIEIGYAKSNATVRFTADSKYCIFSMLDDALKILDLTKKSIHTIKGVFDFKISDSDFGDFLVYSLTDNRNATIVKNLKTNKTQIFNGVLRNWLSDDGKLMLFQTILDQSTGRTELNWMSIADWKIISIWRGKHYGDLELITDFKHKQLAFKVSDSILYYKLGMSSSVVLATEKAIKSKSTLHLGDLQKFNKNGDGIFITLKDDEHDNILKKNVPEIWSYKDPKIQPIQEEEIRNQPHNYLAIIHLINSKLIQLQEEKDFILYFSHDNFDDVILSSRQSGDGDSGESSWNAAAKTEYTVVDTRTGGRKKIDCLSNDPKLSPNGKFIICFDPIQKNYLSYEISTGKQINITSDIKTSWRNVLGSDFKFLTRGIAGWLPDDNYLLVYDSHDIWQLDPTGRKSPTNLTNGYGVKNDIVFKIESFDENSEVLSKSNLLLTAFNRKTKDNGFFNKELGKKSDPKSLSMGDVYYGVKGSASVAMGVFEFKPLKAKSANNHIVKLMSSTSAPNYFSTKDFIKFKEVTNLQPQKKYNWLTSELHSWKSLDGKDLQGILYKPEDFNPNKKYPVIFYYYERMSDGLNYYLKPEASWGPINIPTYVSNGYLIFCPDIYYKIGDPMQGTYDAVISATAYLAKLPFVDSKKIGIQGHSYGGIQTNYLVTHTNLFAAACSSSGLGDWISHYNSLGGFHSTHQTTFETSQNRMGNHIWGNISKYIKNSPVFHADKVTTPLLLMHTKNDDACPFPNILEFYLGLRRLGKKVWMVVYPEASHILLGKDADDFSIRMMQFFDYYLKDKPAPVWLIDGVSPNKREFGAGTKLDTNGRTPGPGLLTNEEQNKVDVLMKINSTSILK